MRPILGSALGLPGFKVSLRHQGRPLVTPDEHPVSVFVKCTGGMRVQIDT